MQPLTVPKPKTGPAPIRWGMKVISVFDDSMIFVVIGINPDGIIDLKEVKSGFTVCALAKHLIPIPDDEF